LALAEASLAFLRPEFGVRLRKLSVAAHDFERGVKLLERLAAQTDASGEFSLELARLYGEWAQADLNAGKPESALAHLRAAHEQHPELFEIASRLSALQQERGDRPGAIQTLESFLAVSETPAEIEQARAQLARLRAGG
jgi:tetratricopeptide (TPR) repeat protein